MRVGFLASFYPQMLGGAEVGLRPLLDGLNHVGLEWKLFTLGKVRKQELGCAIPVGLFGLVPPRVKIFGFKALDTILARRLSRIIPESQIDLLHVQDTYCLPGAIIAAEALEIPIVLSYHNNVGLPHSSFGVPSPLAAWLDRRESIVLQAARSCSTIIADSKYTAEQLVKAGLSRRSVQVVYIDGAISTWGDDLRQRHLNRFRIVAAGRLQHHKGFHVLLLAASEMLSRGADVKIEIVGGGPYRKRLSRLSVELGIEGIVNLTGPRHPREMAEYFDQSDVVVVPSLTPEPFGRVAVEAMSRGKVVIGSNVGGIPEIIDDGETGFLVPPDNPADLAEKLSFLCAEPDIRKKMGRKGLEMSKERFNSTKITRKVLEIYRTLRNSAAS